MTTKTITLMQDSYAWNYSQTGSYAPTLVQRTAKSAGCWACLSQPSGTGGANSYGTFTYAYSINLSSIPDGAEITSISVDGYVQCVSTSSSYDLSWSSYTWGPYMHPSYYADIYVKLGSHATLNSTEFSEYKALSDYSGGIYYYSYSDYTLSLNTGSQIKSSSTSLSLSVTIPSMSTWSPSWSKGYYYLQIILPRTITITYTECTPTVDSFTVYGTDCTSSDKNIIVTKSVTKVSCSASVTSCDYNYGLFYKSNGSWIGASIVSGYYYLQSDADEIMYAVYSGSSGNYTFHATSGVATIYRAKIGTFKISNTSITSNGQSVQITTKDSSGYYYYPTTTGSSYPASLNLRMQRRTSPSASWGTPEVIPSSSGVYFTSGATSEYIRLVLYSGTWGSSYTLYDTSYYANPYYIECTPRVDTHSITYDGTSETSSVSKTVSKPGKSCTFVATYSCTDTSCGGITACSYTIKKGSTTKASGNGTTSSCTATFTPTESGTYTCTFTITGCGGLTIYYYLYLVVQSETVELKVDSTTFSGTYSLTKAYPQDTILKFTDSWVDTSNPLGLYRVVDGNDTLIETSNTSPLTHTISASDIETWGGEGTYQIKYKLNTTVKGTLNLTISPMVSSATYNGNPATQGQVYTIQTTTATTVTFVYNNTYGPYKTIRIYVDGNELANSTNTSVSGSMTFLESGSHTIKCSYDEGETTYYDIEYTVSIVGIITGDGYLTLNGNQIVSTQTVAQFYNNSLTLQGLSGTDASTTYTWEQTESSPTSSDYTLTGSGQSATFVAKNTAKQYRIQCLVYSYGTLAKTITMPSGTYLLCSAKTVAGFTISEHETEPDDEIQCYDAYAIAPTSSGYDTVNYKWYITTSGGTVLTPGTDYVVVDGGGTSDDFFNFTMNNAGEYTVWLEADPTGTSYSTYETGSDSENIIVNNIVQVTMPYQKRICIGIYNGNKAGIIHRDGTNILFQNLKFSSGLNSMGSATFNLVGANNLSDEALLCSPGSEIVIYDKLCPIWSGILTKVNNINVNYYDQFVETKIYSMECMESSYDLSLQYIPQTSAGTQSGTVATLAGLIIPSDHIGSVTSGSTTYAVSLETSSRLTALDTLSTQLGWRYRVRQVGQSYYKNLTVSNGTYTVDSVVTGGDNGDRLIIYDTTNGRYYTGKVSTYSSGTITFASLSSTIPDGTYKFTAYSKYVIDYKPTYYQEQAVREYEINRYATNVDAVSNTTDRFGEVSVYGVGYSGEMLASNMKAWMVINKNYTIPKSAKISKSYDCYIDSVNRGSDVVVGGYVYAKYTVTVNGWSFPSVPTTSHLPRIYYTRSDNVLDYIELEDSPGIVSNIMKTKDQSGTKKTSFVVGFVLTMADGSDVPSTDPKYSKCKNSAGQLLSDVFSSFTPMTNIVFNYMTVSSDEILSNVLPSTGNIRIGDMRVNLTSLSVTGDITFDWILPTTYSNNPIPHGHLTDVLVMDDTGTKYTSGYSWSNPHPESPKGKYPEITKTVQGGEGYTAMEMEKLACRFMQYGSNYSEEGEADIIYNEFNKSDYDMGCKRTLQPGDRIIFQKVLTSSELMTTYQNYNFELLTYSVDLQNNKVEITFGMPLVEIGDVIYNLQSNAGMSIVPADS